MAHQVGTRPMTRYSSSAFWTQTYIILTFINKLIHFFTDYITTFTNASLKKSCLF